MLPFPVSQDPNIPISFTTGKLRENSTQLITIIIIIFSISVTTVSFKLNFIPNFERLKLEKPLYFWFLNRLVKIWEKSQTQPLLRALLYYCINVCCQQWQYKSCYSKFDRVTA